MNNKEKRARFRAFAQQDHIKTGQQFAEEREQPCFDFEGEPAPARRAAKFPVICSSTTL